VDLRGEPLKKRKEKLKRVLKNQRRLLYVDHMEREGLAMFAGALALELEAIVAKDVGSLSLKRNQEIQPTPPQAANQAFAIGICLGRPEGCFQVSLPNPLSIDPTPESKFCPDRGSESDTPFRCQWLCETAARSRRQ
jgi:hypothetical protein